MDKIGPIFGEFITTEKIKRRGYDEKRGNSIRLYIIPIVLIIAVLLILARLFFIQVVSGNYFRTLSDSNRIKTIIIHAPRGIIFDRTNTPLVYNIPGFRKIENGKTKLIPTDEAITEIAKGEKDLEIDSLRQYVYKDVMAHILGYLGQISEEELRAYKNYKAGELIGKMGIEKKYESFLKGEDGKELAEVDNRGKVIRKLGETDPVPGRNIKITIDAAFQKKVYESMDKVQKGAVIVSTPKGEILALVSKPSFDPNLFTLGENYRTAASNAASQALVYQSISEVLSDNENQPFLNRAIGGVYPPGSTFKIVVAAAGLGGDVIDANYSVEDTGIINIGEFSF